MTKGWVTMATLALAGLAPAATADDAAAQVALSVAAGGASYDLSGVGTSGVAAARVEWPVNSWLDLQAGTGFFWYTTQWDDDDAMLLPEAGVLLHLPLPVPLYLGAGAGHTVGVKGDPENDPTLWAALGLELEDRAGWAVRPEMRVRAVDPWTGTIVDFTVGVRRRFGG